VQIFANASYQNYRGVAKIAWPFWQPHGVTLLLGMATLAMPGTGYNHSFYKPWLDKYSITSTYFPAFNESRLYTIKFNYRPVQSFCKLHTLKIILWHFLNPVILLSTTKPFSKRLL
jgi:hypothetical protein